MADNTEQQPNPEQPQSQQAEQKKAEETTVAEVAELVKLRERIDAIDGQLAELISDCINLSVGLLEYDGLGDVMVVLGGKVCI